MSYLVRFAPPDSCTRRQLAKKSLPPGRIVIVECSQRFTGDLPSNSNFLTGPNHAAGYLVARDTEAIDG